MASLADGGQLARDRSWISTVDTIHSAIYLGSFLIVIVLLLWPGRIAPSLKAFALFLLIGIAANAVVCGGISQPARPLWRAGDVAFALYGCLASSFAAALQTRL